MRSYFLINQCIYSSYNFFILFLGAKVLNIADYAAYGVVYSLYLVLFAIPYTLLYLPMLSGFIKSKDSQNVLIVNIFLYVFIAFLAGFIADKALLESGLISMFFVSFLVFDYQRRQYMFEGLIKRLNFLEVIRVVIFLLTIVIAIFNKIEVSFLAFLLIISICNVTSIVFGLKLKFIQKLNVDLRASTLKSFEHGKWLLVTNFTQAVSGNFFIFFIAYIGSVEQVAVVTLYRSVVGVFNILLLSIDNFLAPKLSDKQLAVNNEQSFDIMKKEMNIFTPIFMLLLTLVILFGKPILNILYGSSFIQDYHLLIILLITSSFMFFQRFYLVFLRALSKTKLIFHVGMSTSLLNLLLIVPAGIYFGIEGILASMLLTNILYFCLLLKTSRKEKYENNK